MGALISMLSYVTGCGYVVPGRLSGNSCSSPLTVSAEVLSNLQNLLVLRRSHSRLQNIEFECWVFKDSLPTEARLTELGIEKDNAYYSRITFDPKTLDKRL